MEIEKMWVSIIIGIFTGVVCTLIGILYGIREGRTQWRREMMKSMRKDIEDGCDSVAWTMGKDDYNAKEIRHKVIRKAKIVVVDKGEKE
jgi:hypothetical protein